KSLPGSRQTYSVAPRRDAVTARGREEGHTRERLQRFRAQIPDNAIESDLRRKSRHSYATRGRRRALAAVSADDSAGLIENLDFYCSRRIRSGWQIEVDHRTRRWILAPSLRRKPVVPPDRIARTEQPQ